MIRTTLATFIALCVAAQAGATDLYAPSDAGGTSFRVTCNPGSYLVGVQARTGDWVDSLKIACAPWTGAALGTVQVVDPPIGDSKGGQPNDAFCPAGAAVVATDSAFTQANGRIGFLDEMTMRCAAPTTDRTDSGRAFEVRLRTSGTPAEFASTTDLQPCPADEVAVGFHGRAGLFIDSIALVCGAAPAPNTTHSELGRASVGDPRFGARNRVHGATRQSDASITAESGIGRTSADQARATTQFGMVMPPVAAAPSAAPPAAAPGGQRFAPPMFSDGARLWACINAGDGVCDGRAASVSYCSSLGLLGPAHNSTPRVAGRREGKVRNVMGAACIAQDCPVIDELTCSR